MKIAGSLSFFQYVLLLIWFDFTRNRSDRKWGISAVSGLGLHSLHFPGLTEFRRYTCRCGWFIIFRPTTTFLQTKSCQPLFTLSRFQCKMFRGVPPILTFSAKTIRATYTGSSNPHSIPVPLVRSKFRFNLQEPLMWRIDSCEDAFQTIKILICSSLGLTVIFVAYPYKLHLVTAQLHQEFQNAYSTQWIEVSQWWWGERRNW